MAPGLQSEQLVHMLVHRTKRLNEILPSKHSEKMVKGLEMFLEACQERFAERIEAGVAGENKSLPESDAPGGMDEGSAAMKGAGL